MMQEYSHFHPEITSKGAGQGGPLNIMFRQTVQASLVNVHLTEISGREWKRGIQQLHVNGCKVNNEKFAIHLFAFHFLRDGLAVL